MKVTLAVLADYANVTREGKLNIMGVFDTIRAPRVPATHPAMQLVLKMQASLSELGREHTMVISCMDADGTKLFSLEGSFTVERGPEDAGPLSELSHMVGIRNLVFQKFGGHTIDISVDGDLKNQVSLNVVEVREGPLRLPGV